MDNDQIHKQIAIMHAKLKVVLEKLPRLAGNEVVNFALENFKRQGFLGDTFQPWKPRKQVNKWGGKSKSNGRAILVKTGRLRRSPRVIEANWNIVKVGTDVPYAKVHNEGYKSHQVQSVKEFSRKIKKVGTVKTVAGMAAGMVKAHKRVISQNIPARPFLKDSPYLRNKISRMIAAEILKAIK